MVLLHLARMRRSKHLRVSEFENGPHSLQFYGYIIIQIGGQLSQYLEDGGIDSLCAKFAFKGFIGDQVRQEFVLML